MKDQPFEKLTPQMQARLDKWRKNTLPVKSAEVLRSRWPSKSRAVNKEYGDDLSDFEEAWLKKQATQGTK